MIDWPTLARAVHVLAIVHWIGGLAFVTFVILPSLLDMEAPRRFALFDALERRFAAQARVSTLLAGVSGFYLYYSYDYWSRVAELRLWWIDAMIALWAIFTLMLFVAEPLFLHAWFEVRARRDPDGAFRMALRGHRVLSAFAVVTVLGAAGGAHGLF
uniref:Copper resistance protein D domain-containing protein n=1 Tax=Rhodopseudomonas palustris (strain BisA53) TaxID=316055 RepID=Q07U01_RHOP5